MKLLADENIHRQIVADLRAGGYDVISISEDFPSVLDETVLDLANRNNAILITSDKDFLRDPSPSYRRTRSGSANPTNFRNAIRCILT